MSNCAEIVPKKRYIVFIGFDYEGFRPPSKSDSFDTLEQAREHLRNDLWDSVEIFDCESREVVETK